MSDELCKLFDAWIAQHQKAQRLYLDAYSAGVRLTGGPETIAEIIAREQLAMDNLSEAKRLLKMVTGNPDNAGATKQLATAKPFPEEVYELAASTSWDPAKRNQPRKRAPKKAVTIGLNPETIEKFKATGKGWQSRISDILDATKV